MMLHFFNRHITQIVALSVAFIVSPVSGRVTLAASHKGAEVHRPVTQSNESIEKKLLADLALDDPRKVLNALDDLSEMANPGTNLVAAARKLLPDPRPSVRRKTTRVLGLIHAQLNAEEIKLICHMLKSYDQAEASDALKALRDLNAREAIPEIMPLLKSPKKVLIRDACRTLAVVGNKDIIPSIEPLLKAKDGDILKDAQAAITALQGKN